MITGKTSSGFEFSLPEDTLDDMELLDAVAEADEGKPLAMSRLCLKLLGKPQREKLYNHLRQEDGRVPTQAVSHEIVEILAAFGKAGKN